MKKLLLAFGLLSVCALAFLQAQTPAAPAVPGTVTANVPDVIAEGFRAFMTGGYASATNAWTRNSSMSVDSVAIQAVNNVFLQQLNLAGNFTGAEIIRVVNLSLSVEEVFVAVKYQRGVLFMGFTCYKGPNGWTVTAIAIDKDPTKVLPTNILGGL